jgi:hypothetical protein
MHKYLKSTHLPLISLGAGLLTMILRFILLAAGEDDKGLLTTGSFADVFSWLLSVAAMVIILIGTWNLREASKFSFNFPPSIPGAAGALAAALGILFTSISELFVGGDALGIVGAALGLLAVPALVFVALCRYQGRRPSVLLHGVVCVYLMLHLVSHYRLWSSCPQIQSYGFELLSIVCLMLACYHRATFDAGEGNRRAYAFCALAAVFFSVATLPGCDSPLFFLGCALWMLTNLCNLKALPGRHVKKGD